MSDKIINDIELQHLHEIRLTNSVFERLKNTYRIRYHCCAETDAPSLLNGTDPPSLSLCRAMSPSKRISLNVFAPFAFDPISFIRLFYASSIIHYKRYNIQNTTIMLWESLDKHFPPYWQVFSIQTFEVFLSFLESSRASGTFRIESAPQSIFSNIHFSRRYLPKTRSWTSLSNDLQLPLLHRHLYLCVQSLQDQIKPIHRVSSSKLSLLFSNPQNAIGVRLALQYPEILSKRSILVQI